MKFIKYVSVSLLALICLPAFSMEKKRGPDALERKEHSPAKEPKITDDSSDQNIINLVEDEIIEEDPELAALLALEFAQPITNEEPAHTNAPQKDETTIADFDEETCAADDESTLVDKEPQKCPVPGCKSGPQINLHNHIWYYHGGGTKLISCPECNTQVLKKSWSMHKKLHIKKTCEVCHSEFSLLYINNHLKSHDLHKQDYHICKLCTAEFTGYPSIINHLKKAHGITTKYSEHFKKETREA